MMSYIMTSDTSRPQPTDRSAAVKSHGSVCVLGTGLMGGPIARRLAQGGWSVTAWNRSRHKAESLGSAGVAVADTPASAAAGAELVIVVLESAAVVDHVVFDMGVADAMAAGGVLIDMSSIAPRDAQLHAARLAERRISHLDAPMSGGTIGAAQGSLAIMVGGDAATFARVCGVFEPLGRARLVGPVGAGQLAKLTNQIIVAITIGAVAEGLLLADRSGVDGAAVIDALQGGFADSRILDEHGRRMLTRAFTPGGPVRLQLKDLSTALDAAAAVGLELPLTELVTGLYRSLAARDGQGLDHSALLLELEHRNTPRDEPG
jgi:2-hydroxy-3-oxopropionate reductase